MKGRTAPKRILIMAGGTGGHVIPALSIARYLRSEGVRVEWLGTERGLESRLIPNEGIRLHKIGISGLRGSGLWRRLLSPFVITAATLQSCFSILKYRPHCVLGMGGFATGPGGVAAWLMRRPLLIHEQNAIAGFTNLMLMPFATIIMEAFPGAFVKKREHDKSRLSRWASRRADRVQAVGNPVREEIRHLPEPEARSHDGPLRVLVVGGSRGAVAINQVMPAALATLTALDASEQPEVWHQCGDGNEEATLKAYEESGITVGKQVRIECFIDNMAVAYNWADLVVCRSGALTIAELASAGLASVLVPYPYAVDDHQTQNARYLTDVDAAVLVPEETLSAERLGELLHGFCTDRDTVRQMALRARALSRDNSTEVLAKLCLGVCHG